MASCNYCGTTILFGGKKEGSFRFCNDKCRNNGSALILSEQIPPKLIEQQTKIIHEGPCPKCEEHKGAIDMHTSHRIWSAILLSSWSSKPQISCRSCGIKSQMSGFLTSFLIGWWGAPWGIIMTPIQLIKNLAGIISPPNSDMPSKQLKDSVKLLIAQDMLSKKNENA